MTEVGLYVVGEFETSVFAERGDSGGVGGEPKQEAFPNTGVQALVGEVETSVDVGENGGDMGRASASTAPFWSGVSAEVTRYEDHFKSGLEKLMALEVLRRT